MIIAYVMTRNRWGIRGHGPSGMVVAVWMVLVEIISFSKSAAAVIIATAVATSAAVTMLLVRI